MLLPGNTEGTPMMVGSKDAFKGCVIDPESIKLQDERYAREKEAVPNSIPVWLIKTWSLPFC